MAAREFRQKLLGNKKTERIIFAATPELKATIEAAAKDQCVTASSFITSAVISALAKCEDVVVSKEEESA